MIKVANLTKTYTTFKKKPGFVGSLKSVFARESVLVEAVKPTSFNISKGEFVGLLGPNGAGKTTILKMLSGLIPPTSGMIKIFGEYSPKDRKAAYLQRIGMVMGQRNQLHPDLPALESFRLAKSIYGIEEQSFKNRMNTCTKLFEIDHKLTVPVRKLSLGERMKMELILALLHGPELLYLDEPTIGLDFSAAKQIRSFLADANKNLGVTILLTSHYIKDIEELCRRVIVINHGQCVYDGQLQGLDKRLLGERIVKLKVKSGVDPHGFLNLIQLKMPRFLPLNIDSTPRDTSIDANENSLPALPLDGYLRFSVATDELASSIESLVKIAASSLADILIEERSLEEIFSDLYAKPLSPTLSETR